MLSVEKNDVTHPFEHSPQERDVRETNAMYQKAVAMFGENVGEWVWRVMRTATPCMGVQQQNIPEMTSMRCTRRLLL